MSAGPDLQTLGFIALVGPSGEPGKTPADPAATTHRRRLYKCTLYCHVAIFFAPWLCWTGLLLSGRVTNWRNTILLSAKLQSYVVYAYKYCSGSCVKSVKVLL